MVLYGSNLQTIKYKNSGKVLRLILLGLQTNRSAISKELDLTRTTLTNIVSNLIGSNIIKEEEKEENVSNGKRGRKSVHLSLTESAPLICGINLMRQKITVTLADLQGSIVVMEECNYAGVLSISEMQNIIAKLYHQVIKDIDRKIFAVGITSVGPVDCERGLILKPQQFYKDDLDFAVRDYVEELTGCKAYLAHDVSAAAVAENLYSDAKEDDSFLYVSNIHGLGAGIFLDSRPFLGTMGQNGELEHVSVDYRGEVCECGQRGCVGKYIDAAALKRQVQRYAGAFPEHEFVKSEEINIFDIIRLANHNDSLAIILLEEYCAHLAGVLSTLILTLGVTKIFISNTPECLNGIFEEVLEREINARSYISDYQKVTVRGTEFGLQAAVYGSFAIIMKRVFDGEMVEELLVSAGAK